MAKKKKIAEKVRLFYRGPHRESAKVADEGELQIIIDALKDPLVSDKQKNYAFKSLWDGEDLTLKILFGLKSTLRCLKRKQTRALIYDDTASIHLTKFLNEFAYRLGIPIIETHKLSELVGKSKIQSLLVVSIVDAADISNTDLYRPIDPKPKPIDDIVSSERIDKLFQFLQKFHRPASKLAFRPPVLDKVVSTGKNRPKKEAKRNIKEAKKKEKSTKVDIGDTR